MTSTINAKCIYPNINISGSKAIKSSNINLYLNVIRSSMRIFESIYLPENSIQGEDIPLYIKWNKTQNVVIKIILPNGLCIKELFNVSDNGYIKENNEVIVKQFEVNGYLGAVLASQQHLSASNKSKIVVEFNCDNEVYRKEMCIELFRQDLKIKHVPEEVTIEFDDRTNKIIINDKIKLKNEGSGTCIVDINEIEGSDIRLIDPENLEDFSKNFWNRFSERLDDIKVKFPNYSELIDKFKEFGTKSSSIEEQELKKYGAIFDELEDVFELDRLFLKEFVSIMILSYFDNLSIITQIGSFLLFMKSIQAQKVILFKPLRIFDIKNEINNLNIKITVADLVHQSYEPIILKNIKIVSNKECQVPVYMLFEFNEDD